MLQGPDVGPHEFCVQADAAIVQQHHLIGAHELSQSMQGGGKRAVRIIPVHMRPHCLGELLGPHLFPAERDQHFQKLQRSNRRFTGKGLGLVVNHQLERAQGVDPEPPRPARLIVEGGAGVQST